MNVAPATDAPDSELFWLAKLDDAPQLTGEHERLFVSETAGTSLLVRRPPQNDAELARRSGIVLLLDGELFDTDSLTTALGWGTDSRGSTQAELLLEAYRACGLDVFRLLHGEFAILIWHELSGDLVLARDPLGPRPLSYGQRGGRFYVSPSPELLVESGIPGDINRAGRRMGADGEHRDVSDLLHACAAVVPWTSPRTPARLSLRSAVLAPGRKRFTGRSPRSTREVR